MQCISNGTYLRQKVSKQLCKEKELLEALQASADDRQDTYTILGSLNHRSGEFYAISEFLQKMEHWKKSKHAIIVTEKSIMAQELAKKM